jgi:GNAT superfamily N-acetyltransferase
VPNPSEFVLRFLQTVGRTEDAEFYLRLFRQLPKPSFAFIAAEAEVLEQAIGSLGESLRFLTALGLFPVFAVGLLSPSEPGQARALFARLQLEKAPSKVVLASQPDVIETVASALQHRTSVILDFDEPSMAGNFELLSRLVVHLGTRKLVLLRAAGGLGPKSLGLLRLSKSHQLPTDENGINVINLRTDLGPLQASKGVSADELELLERLWTLHAQRPSLLTSVTSPLNLLRELFTVKGAGTLVKTGSSVQTYDRYSALDQARLERLLEETFGRELRTKFFEKAPLRIYLEASYRGAAIVYPGMHRAAYLTKFAVDRRAQGEGIGRDLWEALLRDYPILYWRARMQNPISSWYATQCDGMQQVGTWRVYWRGISPRDIPSTIHDALAREQDLIG